MMTTVTDVGVIAGMRHRKAMTLAAEEARRLLDVVDQLGAPFEGTWKLGYLIDTIMNRDYWMHRVDLTRATGKQVVLTPQHDGRIVADVVAEWARAHAQPFTLTLEGPAGATFAQGERGQELRLDAIEFCRILSGRGSGSGLLSQEVPF